MRCLSAAIGFLALLAVTPAAAVTLNTPFAQSPTVNMLPVSPGGQNIVIGDIQTGDSETYTFLFEGEVVDFPFGGFATATVLVSAEVGSGIAPSDVVVSWSGGSTGTFTTATGGAGSTPNGTVLTRTFDAGDIFSLTISFSNYLGTAPVGISVNLVEGVPDTVVPLPASVLLLLTGMAGLGYAGFRRRA
jgi:hypothetical protein